ncbi:unnamed protein product [Adineta ricciae]|uniref:HAT C-terminal dimerisation domain-containing protein n=1 Tax=Adineta ricciae TaxID=249248 RepID=A0A815WGN2_ADIRI|nr:unnamed protein product [Adineta ricciae]CAF1543776.1 unnamed protein product [Adineta ricciae]
MHEMNLESSMHNSNNDPDIFVLPLATPDGHLPDSSTTTKNGSTNSIARTIRDEFYINIKSFEKNWSGECRVCHEVKYDNLGVTSNINRHVKSKHVKEYEEWCAELRSVDGCGIQQKISDMFVQKNEPRTKASSSSYSVNHPRQIQLSQSIVENLIIDLGLPLSIVERESFIKFMHDIDPKFTMFSRRTLSRSRIPHLFNNMNDELKKFCYQSQFISLTLDIWTDRRMRAFFAMTGMIFSCSNTDENTNVITSFLYLGHAFVGSQLKSYVLCFLPLYGSHTANLLLQTYENIVNSFDINGKLVRLVTDNASNNIKAYENLIIPGFESYFETEDDDNDEGGSDIDLDGFLDEEANEPDIPVDMKKDSNMIELIKNSFDNVTSSNELLRIPCFAHSIQLVVNDGLKQTSSIQSVLTKVAKIAKLSHSSTIFAEKLEQINKSIPKANKTRWNSQFNTIEKVLSIPSLELNDILITLKRKDLCLLTKDFDILNEFVSLFTLFADATTITQSENIPSISYVAPTLLSIYYDLLNERSSVRYTSSLCDALSSSLVARFGGLFEQLHIPIDSSIKRKCTYELYKDEIFLYSPFLDTKFKLHWINESSLPYDTKKTVCDKITKLVYDHCVVLHHLDQSATAAFETSIVLPSSEPTTPLTPTRSTSKRKSLFSNIEQKTNKRQKTDAFSFIRDEISIYLHDDDDSDRLLLINQANKFKTLTKLATKILSVPATSAPVERIFSQSGFLFRQHRAKMSRRTLQMLTMLKCNHGLL